MQGPIFEHMASLEALLVGLYKVIFCSHRLPFSFIRSHKDLIESFRIGESHPFRLDVTTPKKVSTILHLEPANSLWLGDG